MEILKTDFLCFSSSQLLIFSRLPLLRLYEIMVLYAVLPVLSLIVPFFTLFSPRYSFPHIPEMDDVILRTVTPYTQTVIPISLVNKMATFIDNGVWSEEAKT